MVKGIEKERMKGEDGGRGTLADLDAHGSTGRATALRSLGPEFPSIAISDAPLLASLATLNPPARFPPPSPSLQTRAQFYPALYSAADYSLYLSVAVSVVASV